MVSGAGTKSLGVWLWATGRLVVGLWGSGTGLSGLWASGGQSGTLGSNSKDSKVQTPGHAVDQWLKYNAGAKRCDVTTEATVH